MKFVRDPGLVLYLPMSEMDGSHLMSKDACGHSCAVTGAIWTPRGRSFDGIDDFLTVARTAALDCAGGGITMEVWTCPENIEAVDRLIDKEGGGTNGYLLGFEAANKVLVRMNSDAVNPLITEKAVPCGIWAHIAATWDGATIRAYLNGSADASTTAKAGTINADTADLVLGRWVGGSLGFFDGVMGEVRVYNRALTPLEVQHNYEVTKWRYR